MAANRRGFRDERHFDECWVFKVEIDVSLAEVEEGNGKGKGAEGNSSLNTHYKHEQMSKVNTASFQFGARRPA